MPEARQLGHGLFERFANKAAGPETMVWAKTPPTITEFITSKQYLGQMPLSQRQAKALNDILGDDPLRTFENLELPIESILLWGKGCILGEELLTLADGTERSIKDLADEGVAPVVLSLSDALVVEAQGSVPFLRGRGGECLEVETQSGRSIRVYEEHLFLTTPDQWEDRGWERAGSLKPGDAIACDDHGT